MIFQGGGGLVQQLRRSYSLSDLSTDSDVADVNRNSKSKMLTNIPDEDLEETDDVSMGMIQYIVFWLFLEFFKT